MCLLALLAAGLVPGWAQQDREAGLGAQAAAEIRSRMSVVTDPAVRLYVSELVTKLAGRNRVLTLEIVDTRSTDEPTEPIWTVGHYLFVPTALIRNARDEAEFAGMLAHSLVHEQRGDLLRWNGAPFPIYTIGSEGPDPIRHPIQPDEQIESVADAQAVGIMRDTGYDPAALLHYVSRLHPQQTQRIALLTSVAGQTPVRSNAIVDTSTFQRIKGKYSTAERKPAVPTLYP